MIPEGIKQFGGWVDVTGICYMDQDPWPFELTAPIPADGDWQSILPPADAGDWFWVNEDDRRIEINLTRDPLNVEPWPEP